MISIRRAFTLLELLISLVVLTIIVLGLFNIQTFCDYQVVSAARKAQLQGEASTILEQMAKSLAGTVTVPGTDAVQLIPAGSPTALRAFSDTNGNGVPEQGVDNWVEFNYSSSTYTLTYCANLTSPGGTCSSPVVLTNKMISTMGPSNITFDNSTSYLDASVTLCWDPSQNASPNTALRCGSLRNPQVQMRARIPLLSVSSN